MLKSEAIRAAIHTVIYSNSVRNKFDVLRVLYKEFEYAISLEEHEQANSYTRPIFKVVEEAPKNKIVGGVKCDQVTCYFHIDGVCVKPHSEVCPLTNTASSNPEDLKNISVRNDAE